MLCEIIDVGHTARVDLFLWLLYNLQLMILEN